MSSSVAAPPAARRGLLFIVSAPSGTGKTTLVERLVRDVPNLHMSRSYTSRSARTGERAGVDYNFISRDRFEEMVRDGAFLEWADVFGNYYGTSADDTEACLQRGDDVTSRLLARREHLEDATSGRVAERLEDARHDSGVVYAAYAVSAAVVAASRSSPSATAASRQPSAARRRSCWPSGMKFRPAASSGSTASPVSTWMPRPSRAMSQPSPTAPGT